MVHLKLMHKDPTLNDKNLWYRLVDDSNPDWYFCTIWGPKGMINSVVHAVLVSDYPSIIVVKEPKTNDSDEFI